jgi:hypothetical protein
MAQSAGLTSSTVATGFGRMGSRMGLAKKLAWIAAGYGLAIAGGIGAVAVNELMMPEDIQQGSPGMVAFGDMILFVLAAGTLSLAPTWFLLKLWSEKAPRKLLAALLLIAAIGPASWLAVRAMASPDPQNLPRALAVIGPFIALVAIPRMVFGPVMVMIEAAAIVLLRDRRARTLLAAAMLMDIVPLGLFALHMAAALHR